VRSAASRRSAGRRAAGRRSAGRRDAGFTLIEIVIAAVILVVGILALVGSNRVAAMSARRASLELRTAQLVQEQTERLRTLPIDSLRNGSGTYPAGTASWIVTDSVSYVRVQLAVLSRPEAGSTMGDTVFIYRPR
jgi:prepilin-type N-terminal cleavage/methylation domain-containing protein